MTKRVVTQEEVVSHLAQGLAWINTWDEFLEELLAAKTEQSMIGILHDGADRVLLLGGFDSKTLSHEEIVRRGLDLYLILAEPGEAVPAWKRFRWQGEYMPSSVRVASKACECICGDLMSEFSSSNWDNSTKTLTGDDLERILIFLKNPHHLVLREPYLRRTREFLLKLWGYQMRSWEDRQPFTSTHLPLSPFLKPIEEKPNLLIGAMITAGLSDVLLEAFLDEKKHAPSIQILESCILEYWKNHPFIRKCNTIQRCDCNWMDPFHHLKHVLFLRGSDYEPTRKAIEVLVTIRCLTAE